MFMLKFLMFLCFITISLGRFWNNTPLLRIFLDGGIEFSISNSDIKQISVNFQNLSGNFTNCHGTFIYQTKSDAIYKINDTITALFTTNYNNVSLVKYKVKGEYFFQYNINLTLCLYRHSIEHRKHRTTSLKIGSLKIG